MHFIKIVPHAISLLCSTRSCTAELTCLPCMLFHIWFYSCMTVSHIPMFSTHCQWLFGRSTSLRGLPRLNKLNSLTNNRSFKVTWLTSESHYSIISIPDLDTYIIIIELHYHHIDRSYVCTMLQHTFRNPPITHCQLTLTCLHLPMR